MSYTPGPWNVVQSHYPAIKQIAGPSFSISAVMYATNLTEDDYKKREADLRLIAAAPELVEALAEAVKAYGAEGGPWNVPSDPGGWLGMARAALEKAGVEL